jgi:hypothetical protein
MMLALGMQNRTRDGAARRYGLAYVIAAGALMAMVGIAISEYTMLPNLWHIGMTWHVAAAAFPLFLFATARAGRVRFPATATALTYTLIFLVTQWTLVQFEATPRLAPIVRPLTHMSAYAFPLLLIVPAAAIDLAMRQWDEAGDWKLAAVLGPLFVLLMVAVHWPFGTFLLTSPLAQNDLFLAQHWPYFSTPGSWETEFFNPQPLFSANFLASIGIASVTAIITARAGLAWGSWMRRVRR